MELYMNSIRATIKIRGSETTDPVNRSIRRILFGVPASAFIASAFFMIWDVRLVLLMIAFVLGWTQLVGL